MRTKHLFNAFLILSVSACSEESEPYLSIGDPASPAVEADAGTKELPTDQSVAEMLSSFQPILEGRKYKIRTRNPVAQPDAELETFDVSLDGAPRLVPEVVLPLVSATNSLPVPASTLVALACAYEIPITSDTISPGLGEGIWAPNPGTPISGGGVLDNVPLPQHRVIPQWPTQVYFQSLMYGQQQELSQTCSPQIHWAQEMNLCIAQRYLDLAKTDSEYELVMTPVSSPRSRVPATDEQIYACNDASSLNRCQVLGLTLQRTSTSQGTQSAREQGLRSYLFDAINGGFTDNGGWFNGFEEQEQARRLAAGDFFAFSNDEYLPEQGTMTDAEYLEALVPYYLQPIATFPKQEASDRATLALLAANYFLAAQDLGQRFIDCQLNGNPLPANMHWVDTYDHQAIRTNELIVTRLNQAMLGSIEAAERAQEYITAAASKRVAGDSSEKAKQLFWRGRTNSRLECMHAWTDLSPTLFQDEDEELASLDESGLYPVFSQAESTPEIDRAERMLRDARVNPLLIQEPGGIVYLAQALRSAFHEQMPYSFSDIDLSGDGLTVLATMGIEEADLRAAAFRIIESSDVLGRPILELDGTNGTPLDPIPDPGGGPSGHHYTYGTSRTSAVANPAYLYARSVGIATNNAVLQPGGGALFGYQGVVGGLAASERVLQRLAESFSVPGPGGAQPFFVANSTAPASTSPSSASDRDLVHLTQSAIGMAGHWAPELLGICPDGLVYFFSDERSTEIPEAWLGEAGLECATQGSFGNGPCDPDELRISYTSSPVPFGTGRVPGAGKFALVGDLDLSGVSEGQRIYFTRAGGAGGRKVMLGVTVGDVCNYYPFGDALLEKATECLAARTEEPEKPAICCEGLPCDLKVPLEDSLQSTAPREIESSYMHYVALAREAATRADTLGQQLIDQGLSMDMRAEAAREELEGLCGGVVNVDTLAPKPCTEDSDCASGPRSGMRCMASTGLQSGAQFCTGGDIVDTMESNATAECAANADCGSGRTCVSDGDTIRFCATSCVPGPAGPSNPCGDQCVTGAAGSYCAATCTSDEECTGGRICSRDNGAGVRTCVPSPESFRSIQECLGLAEDNELVPAAIGKDPLKAWKFPGHALCVCPAGQMCGPRYDDGGFPTCPVSADAASIVVPPGAMEVAIEDTLGFSTDITRGSGSVAACQAIAEFRVGRPSGGQALSTLLGSITDQVWMTRTGISEIGRKVDPEYDVFGFLTINYDNSPWLTTGSAKTGPLTATVFPNTSMMEATDPLCSDANPLAGKPLQCRSFATGDLSKEELVRITQVLALFSNYDGYRRVPVAEYVDLEEAFFLFGMSPFVASTRFTHAPTGTWLTSAFPNAILHDVTLDAHRSIGASITTDYGFSGDRNDGKDGVGVSKPQCLDNVGASVGSWVNDIACDFGGAASGDWRPLDRFRGYANGRLHTGLWARNDDTKGDQVNSAIKKLFNERGPGTMWHFLNQVALPKTYEIWEKAPILTERWPTRGGALRVGEVMDALELACLISNQPRGPQTGLQIGCDRDALNQPPSVSSPKDFPKLTNNLRCAADAVDEDLKRMWVPEIPKAIAAAIRESNVTDTVPNYQGQYAQTVAQLQGAFKTVAESTRTVAAQLRAFANELTLAQSVLEKIDKEGKILNWKLVSDIAAQVAACGSSSTGFKTFTGESAVACANTAVQIASAIAISSLEQGKLDEDKRQALVQVSMQFSDRLDSIQAAAESLRKGYTDIQVLQAELQSTRSAAERAAAKVMFLDRDSTGRTYNVNTVMRRNMNTLQVRYDQALTDAKRMAFIARRAIEQRLAMSLENLTEPMSLVEAPNTWVDTACTMGGIDYERIRNADVSPIEGSTPDDFSEGFIGDYVTKLENFVESYRFEYPFRDGSDVAVVSLRDDIRGVKVPCEVAGPNLLYSTATMIDFAVIEDENTQDDLNVWKDVSDTGTSVLLSSMGTSPKGVVFDDDGLGVAALIPGGTAYEMSAPISPVDPEARAYWGQDLFVEAGLYQLSWYERYGATDGGCTMSPHQSWSAVIGDIVGLDEGSGSFQADAPEIVPLTIGTDPNFAEDFIQSCWRRWVIEFDIPEAQTVRVRFGLQDDEVPVVWAQPQLELVDNSDIVLDGETGDEETEVWPEAYFPTTEVLTAEYGQCEDTTGERFQTQWRYGASYCENICPDGTGESCKDYESTTTFATQCYHELRFDIGPGALERGELIPSIARGNFNYRFSRFGINLVGTGLRDCEQAQYPSSCYASGYVQYSLRHEGPFTVINHDGEREEVALFPAQIQHAKALTAERYITNPMSSADRTLMEDFWRSELRGRPMQGAYSLRIYDEPGPDGQNVLAMDKLEDVQLVFEYNYWTRSEQ